MTDATVSDGSWSYTKNLKVKSADKILHMLIDIVSKNGVLLLNVSPMADGKIPENQKKVLISIGDWLKKYGESIYETEAWYKYCLLYTSSSPRDATLSRMPSSA